VRLIHFLFKNQNLEWRHFSCQTMLTIHGNQKIANRPVLVVVHMVIKNGFNYHSISDWKFSTANLVVAKFFLSSISWWSKKLSLILWKSNPFSIMMCKGANQSVRKKISYNLLDITMNVDVTSNTKWVCHVNFNNHVNIFL
jgi:hypothetical protein